MLKAVLFDLDDTLIDWSGFTISWQERDRLLLQGVFDYVCREVHPLDDFDGLVLSFQEAYRIAWETGRSSLRAPNLGQLMLETLVAAGAPADKLDERLCLEAYSWGVAPGVVTFPDVPAVLELLAEQNVQVGIVTNASQPMWLRDLELKELGLLDYFPACRISAADAGYLKPHPRIFECALEQLGIQPSEAVFVGDNPVADIAGAQGAGLKAVLRVRQPVSPMLSGLVVPDKTIRTLEELPDILDEWYPDWR